MSETADPRHKLCGCGGTRQVLRLDIPLEDAIAQALPDYHGLRQGVLYWASHLPVLNSDQTIAPERVRLLFWQAMEKAVSHE